MPVPFVLLFWLAFVGCAAAIIAKTPFPFFPFPRLPSTKVKKFPILVVWQVSEPNERLTFLVTYEVSSRRASSGDGQCALFSFLDRFPAPSVIELRLISKSFELSFPYSMLIR